MTRRRQITVAVLLVLLLIVLLPVGAFYWRARRALPHTDGELRLEGLSQPVRVLRDAQGVPHIYAETLDDLLFAQGFVQAQERLWQMDLLRRTARGRLAEIVGPAALPLDKENRRLGLGSVADRAFAASDDVTRRRLESFTRGINAYIESRSGNPLTSALPLEFALLHYRPEPWRPADTLAVGLNLFKLLTRRWQRELARTRVEEMLTADLAGDLFVTHSATDHPIAVPVQPPRRPRRRRVLVAENCRHSLKELLASATPLPSVGCLLGCGAGSAVVGASNNWVVSGAHTASGAPLLANDMHLPHSVPSIWFINHLVGPDLDVTGFSLPGLPFIIAGHNRNIAWGFTNLMADVQDLFAEQFDPGDSSRYLTPQGWQAVQRRREHIVVRGADDVDLEVLETRHGPIVHEDGELKFALRWTALNPQQISMPFLSINRAANWAEFMAAMAGYGGPPQNAVYADREGHIGYHAIGRLPVRKNGRGETPVPGHSGEYDWVGYVPFENMPRSFDPPEGVLATANNRVAPRGYPVHITDRWMSPSRIHRIYQVLTEAIEQERKFARDDMLRLQGDILSLPNLFIARQLLAVAETAGEEQPAQRAQALALLKDWNGEMRADSAAPLIADATRRRLLRELLEPKLGDDWQSYNWWMAPVFLENVLRERPERWLPPRYADYDALLLAALDTAVDGILRRTRAPALDRLRWGDQMRVQFRHPVGDRLPVLRRWFSVGGEPQSGGRNTVKQTGRTFGPSERLVVDFSNLDSTLMNVTVGQSGHIASPHYRDHFPAWLAVRSFPSPFTQPAVEQAATHTLHLLPR